MYLKSIIIACCFCLIVAPVVHAGEAEDYQRDAGAYRDAYTEYSIKKGAYTQLNTFATEEELIQAAQRMLLARADVWTSYWKLLWINMSGLQEFPIEDKIAWRQKLIAEADWLTSHKEAVQKAKTREDLNQQALLLNDKSNDLGVLAFAANADITIGSLIQSTQKLLNFNQELLGRVSAQQFTAEEKETKTRGLEVQAERINAILTQLKALRTEYKDSVSYASAQAFSKINQETAPLYIQLSQQFQIAKELAEGVEW